MVKKILVSDSTVQLFEKNNLNVESVVKTFMVALGDHKSFGAERPSVDNPQHP